MRFRTAVHAWLLTWLHQPDSTDSAPSLRQVSFLLQREAHQMGIFATRGPRRDEVTIDDGATPAQLE